MINPFRSPILFASPFIVALLFTFSSCNSGGSSGSGEQTVFSPKLVRSVGRTDLERRLKAELTRWYERQNAQYLYSGPAYSVSTPSGVTTTGNQPQTATPGSVTDTTHSETNVQETGVDEGDLVKTDGTYIYVGRGTHFFVLLANPATQLALVSDIDLQEPISEIYLTSGKVTIITAQYGPLVMGEKAPDAIILYRPITKVYCYDVTTPPSPILVGRFDFPGSLQGSRRVIDTVYVVTNFAIDIPSPVTPWDYLVAGNNNPDAFNEASKKALAENLIRINDTPLDNLLPTYTATFSSGPTITAPAVSFTDIFIPEFGNGVDLALVFSIDLSGAAPALIGSTAVLSSWCMLYMSPNSLYLASDNNWLWIEPMMGSAMPQANPEPRTAVHKFALSGQSGQLSYAGSGVVDGWVNNRFSMSDYLGYLRIGTTRGGWWGEGISNQLAVLAEKDGSLTEVGKLSGLSPGESIYAMRYDRDRGYMVTFRQTDPLFTFDLSDPANPRIAGEITVNGFATYVHLLGTNNDKLLTIGRSADPTGRIIGNKLQLFDVSDIAAPKPLGYYELGAGWSDALYDTHAFLYYEPLGILTIPYYSFGGSFGTYSSGLEVFNIGPSSISLRGNIPAAVVTIGYGNYLDTVDRSVIIGSTINDSTIFSVAHRSITSAGANQLNIIKVVSIPESYSYVQSGPGTIIKPN